MRRLGKSLTISIVVLAAVVFLVQWLWLRPYVRIDSFGENMRLATIAANRFHAQFNADQFQAIYDEATPAFQNGGGRTLLLSAMKQSKERFGNVLHAEKVAANAFPGGEVRFVYNTRCEKGDTTEFFVWRANGKTATLVHYQISPGTKKPKSHRV